MAPPWPPGSTRRLPLQSCAAFLPDGGPRGCIWRVAPRDASVSATQNSFAAPATLALRAWRSDDAHQAARHSPPPEPKVALLVHVHPAPVSALLVNFFDFSEISDTRKTRTATKVINCRDGEAPAAAAWRGTRRQSAAGDGVPPSLQIPPDTHILLARRVLLPHRYEQNHFWV